MTPKFYNDPVFYVPEAAQVAGATEPAFRSMLARGGAKFIGLQRGGRTLFSCHELFIARLAVALSRYGLTGEAIWQTAHAFAGGDSGLAPEPDAHARIHHNDDGELVFEWSYTGEPLAPLAKPSLTIPTAAIWRDVVDQAAEIYAMGG